MAGDVAQATVPSRLTPEETVPRQQQPDVRVRMTKETKDRVEQLREHLRNDPALKYHASGIVTKQDAALEVILAGLAVLEERYKVKPKRR